MTEEQKVTMSRNNDYLSYCESMTEAEAVAKWTELKTWLSLAHSYATLDTSDYHNRIARFAVVNNRLLLTYEVCSAKQKLASIEEVEAVVIETMKYKLSNFANVDAERKSIEDYMKVKQPWLYYLDSIVATYNQVWGLSTAEAEAEAEAEPEQPASYDVYAINEAGAVALQQIEESKAEAVEAIEEAEAEAIHDAESEAVEAIEEAEAEAVATIEKAEAEAVEAIEEAVTEASATIEAQKEEAISDLRTAIEEAVTEAHSIKQLANEVTADSVQTLRTEYESLAFFLRVLTYEKAGMQPAEAEAYQKNATDIVESFVAEAVAKAVAEAVAKAVATAVSATLQSIVTATVAEAVAKATKPASQPEQPATEAEAV